MSNPLIIFVHGGFHWGGCFAKVATLLAARGKCVLTPDLAGHGFDTKPRSQIRSMADYTAPIARLIEQADEPVVLIGHSMGGISLSYLGERYPDKIARLIYLSAVMLPPGASATDASEDSAQSAIGAITAPAEDGSGIRISPIPEALAAGFYGDCSAHDIAIATRNLTEINPLPPFIWRSDVTPEKYGRIPRVYIETIRDQAVPIAMQRAFQTAFPGTIVHTMDCAHSPFFSHPSALVDLIAASL